ncbi:SCO family protein [Planctomycetota bacterium]|nr:SCO family protein [Planctomycetota bacterium]
MIVHKAVILLSFLSVMLSGTMLSAQGYYRQGELPRKEASPEIFDEVTLEEKLGDEVPMDLEFTDQNGNKVKLADFYKDGKPVVLNLGYYECPMLCGVVMQGLTDSVKELNWKPGDEYRILTVSFDHTETPQLARDKRDTILGTLGGGKDRMPEDGWVFLTGDEENVNKLTQATGFGFKWDEASKQFAHPAAIVITSPEGKITKYMAGIVYPPTQMKLALMDASKSKVGSFLDQIVMMCFQYDHTSGQYTLAVTRLMKFAGWVTVLILGSVIGLLLLRERKKRKGEQSPPSMPS